VHLRERNLPRIVLLDCDDEVAASLEAEGYDVAFGYTGYFVEHPDMDVPPALHEKDLLIIDLDPGWTPRPQEELWPPDQGTLRPRGKHAREPRYGGEPLSGFASSLHRGGLIICLLEGATSPGPSDSIDRWGDFGWLPAEMHSGTVPGRLATVAVAEDTYLHLPQRLDEESPNLHQLLASRAQNITSLRALSGVAPLVRNDASQPKAGVFHPMGGGAVWLLPYFKRKPAALHRLIGVILPEVNPELFPVREDHWTEEDAYQSRKVLDIRRRREDLVQQQDAALAALNAEEAAAVNEQRPFTDLLAAHGDDLHPVVRDALDWLGFDVADHDAANKAAAGRLDEDLQVKDGGYFALVEVTSAKGNAKDKDFLDLDKYRRWRAQNPGRSDIDVTDIRGLLIVNQMYEREPTRRDRLFASSATDWPQQAAETGITLVATWELFKLIRDLEAGTLSRAQARATLQEPGLFVWPLGS
jgi:hypothetical protein